MSQPAPSAQPIPSRFFVALWRGALSFPAMIAVALCLVTFLSLKARFNDPDLWWHLKVGEIIWNTRSLPSTDLFSYTTGNTPWIPHEWLSEVAIYAAYQAGGYRGLWLWMWGCASLIVVVVYALCWLYSGNAKVALLGGLTGWFFATVGLAIRPHLLGYLFLAVELLLLELGRARGRRWFWALPPLFALWVNCHGSYLMGLLVLGIYAICSSVDGQMGAVIAIRRSRPERLTLYAGSAACLAALLLNPVGPKLLTYPLDVFTRQAASLDVVVEWQPLTVSDERALAFFGLAGALGLILMVRPALLQLEELLVLAVAFAAALRHVRLLFAFGILVAPILTRLLADAWDRYDPDRDLRPANATLMLAAAAIMMVAFPTPQQFNQQVHDGNPAGAVEFIQSSGLSGPMVNQYAWGGYLIWALPQQKVFIDGRGDVYIWTGVLDEFGRWATVREDPQLLLKKYGVQYCILSKDAPIAVALAYVPGWQKVYSDKLAVVFARRSPA